MTRLRFQHRPQPLYTTTLAEVVLTLLVMALVGGVTLAVALWPEVRRLRDLWRENEKLQREHDRLVQENRGKAEGLLERWTPRRGTP